MTPTSARFATSAPPTLCAMFQVETVSPRSFVLNQCTMVLPQGGQPMPCTQPLTAMIAMMAASDA